MKFNLIRIINCTTNAKTSKIKTFDVKTFFKTWFLNQFSNHELSQSTTDGAGVSPNLHVVYCM